MINSQHTRLMKQTMIPLMMLFSLIASAQGAEAPAPPTDFNAEDVPGDAGDAIDLSWKLSVDDKEKSKPRKVLRYVISRKEIPKKEEEVRKTKSDTESTAETKTETESEKKKYEYQLIGETTYQVNTFRDSNCEPGVPYLYRIVAIGQEGLESSPVELKQPVIPILQWFNLQRSWFAVFVVLICGSVILFIEMARRGKKLKVRKIAGLEAITDAVGRATEMGRSCLFVPGIQDINDIQTVAGITVLAQVAETTADYRATLEVPTSRSLVMTTARDTVEAAYLAAGRPDEYNEDDIYYITDEQFGYVASVTGKMVRDKPAACFYMGAFYAESLILAETGNSVGAIQVAGTAMPSQLPFFVAACDFTLIGEEFFAASAYLSREPQQLGSLKGQDFGKLVGGLLLLVGCVIATLASFESREPPPDQTKPTFLQSAQTYIIENILGKGGFK
ncbi:hypothetical protein Pan153_41230 [Gimesia panareensis]|uniref:Fibronectin type-III domain-containing protein n=1 Tax=Gimesia panareensis TaxID=2527978 RepID=A0A518FSY4_9PLAN|nr:DUF6754 domain-containing protein [Gimesia panareensis]QDV19458.1 hypothetical protein Pan153_41230 [Gimesia panareensis]